MPLTSFHPTLQRWFSTRLGEPTAPQRDGWPLLRAGRNVLIAAPTGAGKTLAAFFGAIDELVRQGEALPDTTQVVYVSPLKALSNDIQKNLSGPLAEMRAMDPSLPEIRVMVRTGDTPASQRAAMTKRPPHILVTTPESLYILLTSAGGRKMLGTAKTVIVDEIHALARDKRGSHLALSLERLEALTGPLQRVGLSATQKPIEEIAHFLAGTGRPCEIVDAGHLRELDIDLELPPSPLSAVCSHEQWEEIYARMAELVKEHRTTLVFVNTRKMAERVGARLGKLLGEDKVRSHHGSLSRVRRLEAEQALKRGELRALVATASLELGIDIGEVDLVLQVGTTRSIATFLQRVGRAGHVLSKTPKGRLFPLTRDELVEGAAVLRSVKEGLLDRTPPSPAALDILAQQIVASAVTDGWSEEELFAMCRRAWPYRDLARDDFDAVLSLHSHDGQRRGALLHRDGVHARVMATKRARITAITSGGAIPDNADYEVRMSPEGTLVGSVNEDFAIETTGGDIFQLGNASWRVLRVEPGVVRVADAKGAPPSLPFWLGEAPARTAELSGAIARLREDFGTADIGTRSPAVARELSEYLAAGSAALGAAPTTHRVVLERFFDESGGMQLVVHAPFGSRINRAWALTLRKRFCRGFGFELQAAANEEAFLLSLGPQHSFPLEEVFDYLHPNTARELLVQALLVAPMFETRWRWNAQRALLYDRMRSGKRAPAALLRMRANDALLAAFPDVLACPETLDAENLSVPMDHPIVRQTVEDCLTEAMDVEGFLAVLRGLRDGSIERRSIDTTEPSPFSHGILNAQPYAFLDDAPLEERRTHAVATRRTLDPKSASEMGALDPAAILRVKEEAWPHPENAEEVHEALLWIGYITESEGRPWAAWLEDLRAQCRVTLENGRWLAAEASREPLDQLRGRMEALGPVESEDPLFISLEQEGVVLRTRIEGCPAWCHRRLLARIHRYTLDRLRAEIRPVTASQFLRFLAAWQHASAGRHLDGPRGTSLIARQLAGFEIPAAAWEGSVLPSRLNAYRRDWLDQATLSGELAWGRLWGSGAGSIRTTPVCVVPREDLDAWLALAPPVAIDDVGGNARPILAALSERGPTFQQDLARTSNLLPSHFEMGLAELVSRGLVTCDSWSGLRGLIVPPSRRRAPAASAGRWSLLRRGSGALVAEDFVARQLLRRTGVVFRKTLAREKIPVPWRDLLRTLRTLEARGEVRGGRFVEGFDGEQYALPEAVELLRKTRNDAPAVAAQVGASDPLNLKGILTPDDRVPTGSRGRVEVG